MAELLKSHPQLIHMRSDASVPLGLIHAAAKRGTVRAASLLLNAGASASVKAGNLVDDEIPDEGYFQPGWTPLLLAARGGHVAMVALLLEHGASADHVTHEGCTALHTAAAANSAEVGNMLLARGARTDRDCSNPDFDEELGWHFAGTPLHVAANCGSVAVARCLLGHGAEIDQKLLICRRTPLMYAAARGQAQMVDLLLRAGADPNLREEHESQDFTPLHRAASNGHLLVVKLLLAAGADPMAKVRCSGDTAEQLAEGQRYQQVAALIRKHGSPARCPRMRPSSKWDARIERLRDEFREVQQNIEYVDAELDGLELSDDLKKHVQEVVRDVASTIYDVQKEVRNLEDKLGMHPDEEPFDPEIENNDPMITTGLMRKWLIEGADVLYDLVNHLQPLAQQDSIQYGEINILLTESSTNILRSFKRCVDVLASIEADAGGERGSG